jgi:alanyl-tRNA synthetase
MDRQQLRSAADWLRSKGADVVVLGGEGGAIISAVRKEVSSKVHAGKLLGLVAAKTGGKGGGRPDMAEGGAKDAGALREAIESVPELLKGLV